MFAFLSVQTRKKIRRSLPEQPPPALLRGRAQVKLFFRNNGLSCSVQHTRKYGIPVRPGFLVFFSHAILRFSIAVVQQVYIHNALMSNFSTFFTVFVLLLYVL
jgi:hypothetical protein